MQCMLLWAVPHETSTILLFVLPAGLLVTYISDLRLQVLHVTGLPCFCDAQRSNII